MVLGAIGSSGSNSSKETTNTKSEQIQVQKEETATKEETGTKEDKTKTATKQTKKNTFLGEDGNTYEKETKAEQVLVDNELCTITYKGLKNDQLMKSSDFKLNIVNKTDRTIIVQTDACSIDDEMKDSIISCQVSGGKQANDEISIWDNLVTTDQVRTMQITFNIIDENFSTLGQETVEFNLNEVTE